MGGVLDRKISGAAPVLALKPSAVTKITEREAERRDQADSLSSVCLLI